MKWLFGIFLAWLMVPVSLIQAAGGYTIENFDSLVVINQDTSITVTETIKVNFAEQRHGIFRVIPVRYSNQGRTINADFELISVTDEQGDVYSYEVDNYRQSKRIKIGDAGIYVNGEQIYVITYRMDDILQVYDDQPELYWNVTGSEWDTQILSAEVEVVSKYADISRKVCYAGVLGSTSGDCVFSSNQDLLRAETGIVRPGNDFTVVIGLAAENKLVWPSVMEVWLDNLLDNAGYFVAILPGLLMGILWYRRGRDQQYLSGNVYYSPEDTTTKAVSVLGRKALPMVYAPIEGLSPAELGTIMDEKVDLQDVVAEVMELVRRKYLELYPVETEGIFFGLGGREDFVLVRTDKVADDLESYQAYLLEKLFNSSAVKKSLSVRVDKKKNSRVPESIWEREHVFVSSLKNNFYTYLAKFREMLYLEMQKNGYFAGNPEKVRTSWIVIAVLIGIVGFIFSVAWADTVGNGWIVAMCILSGVMGVVFGYSMPRRTPKGYALYRQILGLRYFIGKGKWRYEIHERNLFVEEIMPLAIAMGVLDKLTKQMEALQIQPPEYVHSANAHGFSSYMNSMQRDLSSGVSTAPSSSGKSSWSGGSGFSGGSSGGGFGGGGGGSW